MMGIKRARLASVGLLCGLLVGCGGGGGGGGNNPQPPPQPQTIVFNTIGPISSGAGTTVTNLASGGAGTGAITYASSNTAVATVNVATGVASLLTVGSATITATKAASAGFMSATATYTLNVSQGQQTLTFATTGPVNALLDATGSNVASGGSGTGAITYASSDTSAVTVNATSGATAAVGVGSAVITATKAADANFFAGQATYTINVQSAGKLGAWIGKDDSRVHLPQAANGKMLGSARVEDCQLGDTVVECSTANLSASVTGAPVVDSKATLTTQAYYAIVDGNNVGTPIVARASRFSERLGHAVVRFNNRYWVFGGATPIFPQVTPTLQYQRHADVWSSEDGATWKLETNAAAFGRRWLHRTVVFNGAIWMISGHAPEDRGSNAQGVNDVYSSTDGVTWTFVGNSFALLPAAPFDPINLTATVFNGAIWIVRNGQAYSTTNGVNWTQQGSSGLFGGAHRANASLTVYAGSMWYIGGAPNFVNNTSGTSTNEVYRSSANGSTWTLQPNPFFAARFQHSAFVRNGRLWVFGGRGVNGGMTSTLAEDAWSTDGTTWQQETTTGRLARGFYLETVEEPNRVTIIGGLQGTYSNQVWQSTGTAQWEHRSSHAQFSARHTEGVAFNGYLWAIGGAATNEGTFGSGDVNDVWRSADGLNWSRIATTGPIFSERDGHRLAVFNNRLWLIGGWNNSFGGTGTRYKDVWSTADGASWTQHATPPFTARVGHALVSYAGRLWVIGGSPAAGTLVNDVWSSADGESWRPDTMSAAFSPRASAEVVAFNGAMWLIAGSLGTAGSADVWSSTDGVNWAPRAAPPFPARTWHAAAVMNGRLYVVGGVSDEDYESGTRYNDVWSTADGVTWREDTAGVTARFTPRSLHALVARNNELWMIGGLGLGYSNEVWRSTDGANWRVGFTHDIVTP